MNPRFFAQPVLFDIILLLTDTPAIGMINALFQEISRANVFCNQHDADALSRVYGVDLRPMHRGYL